MAAYGEQDGGREVRHRTKVPPLSFLPAGAVSSKQSSIEGDDPSLEISLSQVSVSTPCLSVSSPGDIIVYEHFTPKECVGMSQQSQDGDRFPESLTAGERGNQMRGLLRGVEGGVEGGEQEEEKGSGRDMDASTSDQALSLHSEIACLKASVLRYEQQNQELRREIHLSTNDLLLLDKAKREVSAEVAALRGIICEQSEDIKAVNNLFERLSLLLDPEDATALCSETVAARCETIYSDFEMMSSKMARLKVMYEHVVAENKRLIDTSDFLNRSEKRNEELQSALIQKEKLISVLEDQLTVLRSTASKGTASTSGRNSSEACKRPELLKSSSSSFSKSPTPLYPPKPRGKDPDSSSFSSYLIEDPIATLRTSSASSNEEARLKNLEEGKKKEAGRKTGVKGSVSPGGKGKGELGKPGVRAGDRRVLDVSSLSLSSCVSTRKSLGGFYGSTIRYKN